MASKIKVGILGGAGYTGGELLRILIYHPEVEITFVNSKSNTGNFVYEVHGDLFGETELKFTNEVRHDVDVVFLCVGHGDAKKILEELHLPTHIKIIDLSQDFRIGGEEGFVYGLPELQREAIKKATKIANPGCFATSIQLALLPMANAALLTEDIQVSAITGSTGAGQQPTETTHFSWRANNLSVYKAFNHQHLKEINQSLNQLFPSFSNKINFIPYRGDFTRGIIASVVVETALSIEESKQLYKKFYASHPFTHVSDTNIDLKQVVNTNKALLYLEKQGDELLIVSIIDNLVKGASGQATQNLNLIFGLEETTGLRLKPVGY
jgi:N-acetyl-gamma-glutamyl-phosphate reductase